MTEGTNPYDPNPPGGQPPSWEKQPPLPPSEPPPYGQPPAYAQHPPPGQPQYGRPEQQPPHGQPAYGQQPEQTQYGQPAYAQPAYGQPPPAYGQPAYGQPPPPAYGQPAYGQPAYGAPAQVPGLPPGVQAGGMGERLLARLVDGLVLLPLTIVLQVVILTADSLAVIALTYLLYIAASGAYEIGMIATRGATIGKKVLKLKVVRLADGAVPGGGPAAGRYFSFVGMLAVGAIPCGLGSIAVLLSPLFDKSGRRQGWHDKIAKTVVIKAG